VSGREELLLSRGEWLVMPERRGWSWTLCTRSKKEASFSFPQCFLRFYSDSNGSLVSIGNQNAERLRRKLRVPKLRHSQCLAATESGLARCGSSSPTSQVPCKLALDDSKVLKVYNAHPESLSECFEPCSVELHSSLDLIHLTRPSSAK
jgi:hypothetical protein